MRNLPRTSEDDLGCGKQTPDFFMFSSLSHTYLLHINMFHYTNYLRKQNMFHYDTYMSIGFLRGNRVSLP